MTCKECNSKYIVNKKYQLCDKCNTLRLHSKSKQEIYSQRKNKTKVKKDLTKEKYIEVLKQIDKKREHICSGCGLKNVVLSHSHIIAQRDCKNYGFEELIYDEKNIVFHCIGMYNDNDCHKRWENPKRRNELLDYEKNMEYIKSISVELYNKYLWVK